MTNQLEPKEAKQSVPSNQVGLSTKNTKLVSSTSSSSAKNSLIEVSVKKNLDVSFYSNGFFSATLIGILLLYFIIKFFVTKSGNVQDFELDEAEFGLGENKIKLKVNDDDRQIAYKIWVELSTRKIGLSIDLEHDVIVEIYDSWHTFFSVTRELIKDVPVRKYRRDSTEKIVRLSIEVLNDGLRPHLTKWQAKFRRWYEQNVGKTDFVTISPQEIQKQYPLYDELAEDLKLVNDRLIAYRKRMHQLIKK